jgi:hypothetical protein
MLSVINLLSGVLLLYTAIIVPVQICMWKYDDPCNAFPTLYFDVIVDSFFLVICQILHSETNHSLQDYNHSAALANNSFGCAPYTVV